MAVERKKKLSVTEQIKHMSDKGIQFNIENEEFAAEYLTNNTYYFKLKAYEKLYNKSPSGPNKDKYINLEFAYLRDLATIDSLLRKKILSIAIDIEHYLKVALLKDFNNSPEDGYEIIDELFALDPEHFKQEINSKLNSRTCKELVEHYKDSFAIWNIVEILSFKDFSQLYELFYTRNKDIFCKNAENKDFKGKYFYLIKPVRMLRNVAAHNNCLLINLNKPPIKEFRFAYPVFSFLGREGIASKTLRKQMSKTIIHDFCVMLYLFHKLAPKSAQVHTFTDLKQLFLERIVKNKEYYKTNCVISSAYEFMLKVINIFCKKLDI